MKNVLILSALLGFAAVANAGAAYPQYPLINGVSVENLCDAGATLQTISPVEVCTQWENVTKSGEAYQGNDFVCVSKATQSLTVSKTYSEATCLDHTPSNIEANYPATCHNVKTVEKTLGNTVSVPVVQDQGEAGLVQVNTLTYTIPACK